jgi:hypothetical protein
MYTRLERIDYQILGMIASRCRKLQSTTANALYKNSGELRIQIEASLNKLVQADEIEVYKFCPKGPARYRLKSF